MRGVQYLALPKYKYLPSEFSQQRYVGLISLDISFEFWSPITLPGFRQSSFATEGMLMPKAAVDKDDALTATEDKIRFTRKVLDVQSIAIPKTVCDTPYQHLRLGIFARDASHVLRAPYFAKCVHNPN